MAPKFFLVDGHSHCYRAYYALQNMTGPDGRPTNMVYGFAAMLRKVLRDYAPDYLAVVFDKKGPTFRHKMYADYKANRKPPPEDFSVQIPVVHELLEAWGVPYYEVEGYEADDLIGALARQATEAGLETRLLTSDKDAEQLLSTTVSMLDVSKGKATTVDTLAEAKSITPQQVVEVMALSGDATDNVPGIPKVGPKTAIKLIQEHGSLEGVLAAAPAMKRSKLRENLIEHAEDARLSLKLVTIDTDAPAELDLDACRVTDPDEEKLRPLYERLGFRQFLSETGSAPTQEEKDYTRVDDEKLFDEFLKALRRQKEFALDVETTSTHPVKAELVGLSASWLSGSGYYLPFRAPLGEKTLDRERALADLRPILENEEIAKIGQNIKYDAIVLRRHGIHLRGIGFDTMLAAYILNPELRRFGLDDLALSMLQYRCIPISDLIGKGAKQITMDQVPVDRVCEYACEDADITWRLAELLRKSVRDAGFEELYRGIELPLIDILVDMEISGVRLDPMELRGMSQWLAERIEELEAKIQQEAGVKFNPASPKQLAEVLFEELGLPTVRRTKTGASTDAEVLQQLAPLHAVPGLVIEYRQYVKLKNTYVDALPDLILPKTGRIHTSFSQTATATGRLSSREPNLQNIPIRTDLGNRIRKAFVPGEDGWLLLSADYSQIELRVLAHLSGDEALREAFGQDQDIHRFVAAQVFGVPADEVSPEQRRTAKAVNFGIVYGLTAYGLSRDIGVPVKEADAFINAYFERHPGVKRFIDETLEFTRKNRYVETMRGRRRQMEEIDSRNPQRRAFAERAAVNTVVQGSAADLIKLAMIALGRRLDAEGLKARMLLQIHDELLFETPPEERGRLETCVVEEMEKAIPLDVPVKVNVAVGPNWLEAK